MSTAFQVRIRCISCGTRYKRTMRAADEDQLAMLPDPPCPTCMKVERVRGMKFGTGVVPSIGGSLIAKAVDTTAEIVMEDYKMGDLRSDVREGESMAPKLAPKLQALADGMFSRPRGNGNPNNIMGLPTNALIKAAVGGRWNTPDTVNPVAVQHKAKSRPAINIIAGDGVRGN